MNIISIGTVEKNANEYKVKLNREYKKGLKGLEHFSHIHVIAISKEGRLEYITGEMVEYSFSECRFAVRTKSAIGESPENEEFSLIDIKPYMPSEDNARTTAGSHIFYQEGMTSIIGRNSQEEDDSSDYELNCVGQIRNREETYCLKYDSIKDMPKELGEYIHVIWWFDKFDRPMFRRILQCETPYESDGKAGVFACRAPIRPNPIAVTTVKVTRTDLEHREIYVSGIDCFDKSSFLGVINYDVLNDKYEKEDVRLPGWAGKWAGAIVTEGIRDNLESIEKQIESLDKAAAQYSLTGQYGETEQNEDRWSVKSECGRALTNSPQCITVKAARENNLKGISVSIPYGKITAVVGVSGSGKSSLVMDTVYAECQRRMEYLQSENVTRQRPEMDRMEGCLPVVMISQKEIRACANSTIGTFSGVNHHLRSIYASIGRRNHVSQNGIEFKITPSTFSFLDPECRCQACNGRGVKLIPDVSKIITNEELSLLDGASPFLGKLKTFIANPNANWMKGQVVALAEEEGVDLHKAWKELPENFKKLVLNGDDRRTVTFSFNNRKNGRKGDISRKLEGIIPVINRTYIEADNRGMGRRFMSELPCDVCKGERLGLEGRMVTLLGIRFPVAAAMTFEQLSSFAKRLKSELPEEEYDLIKENIDSIIEHCDSARQLGIEYLELNRDLTMISGGEAQRLKLLSAFMNHMTGLLYIFDEPSKKLSSREYGYIIEMMRGLVFEGNTVLMVEHNMDMIKVADYVIEVGPKAGNDGGYLMAEGTLSDVVSHRNSMLGRYAKNCDVFTGKNKRARFDEYINIDNVNANNVHNLSTRFPKKALTCITGVSGSGKSTLMYKGILPMMEKGSSFDSVILVESKIASSSSRSVVATYIGIMDEIRKIFADTEHAVNRNLTEKDFSFNTGSLRCNHCGGDGRIKIPFSQDSFVTCPVCHGKRYNKEIESVLYKEKNIPEIMEMSALEAKEFFKDSNSPISEKCSFLVKVGLSYLRLGQSTSTLSGGEAARLKIASSLMNANMKNSLFLLDEPTCGLHFSDIDNLINLLEEIIEAGNTVVAIEHNKRFLSAADVIITMGPGSGNKGGRIQNSIIATQFFR